MNWANAASLAETYGESFFIYDEAKFKSNFEELSFAFNSRYPHTKIAYSYKTNYTPDICKLVNELGGYAEVVSEMEYFLAKRLGVPDNKIIYNGPYKSAISMRTALVSGSIVNIDSIRDLDVLLRISSEVPTKEFNVAIRCNFKIDNELESRFGLDVSGDEFRFAIASINNTPNVKLAGLHCHFPNRDLPSYAVRAKQMLELSCQLFQNPPDFINLGGGFFGAMPNSLKNIYKFDLPSFNDYADLVGGLFDNAYKDHYKKPILFIEPGTALVANTFEFYTKVINIKEIRGRRIVTVSGSIFNISPVARSINLPVNILNQRECIDAKNIDKLFDVAGFTCIESDYLSRGVKGIIEVGDFLVYSNVGSYSIVMKPPFILPNYAILKKVDGSVDYMLVRKQESPEYIFSNFTSY